MDNLEVVKNFAGHDYENAKYYPEDDEFLLEFEEKVEHFEVFASPVRRLPGKVQGISNLLIPRDNSLKLLCAK